MCGGVAGGVGCDRGRCAGITVCPVLCTAPAGQRSSVLCNIHKLLTETESRSCVAGVHNTPFPFSQDNTLCGALVGSSTVR